MQHGDIPPGTFVWVILGLCAAVSTLAIYIAKQAEQRRKDDRLHLESTVAEAKAIREVMLTVVKDNTVAMTKLSSAVDSMKQTFHQYTRQER